MISTINVTTVTTVTAFASTTSLGVIGIAILLLLLMQKEFVATRSSLQSKTLGEVLNIAIMPLLVIFALIVVVKLAEILWMS